MSRATFVRQLHLSRVLALQVKKIHKDFLNHATLKRNSKLFPSISSYLPYIHLPFLRDIFWLSEMLNYVRNLRSLGQLKEQKQGVYNVYRMGEDS
jgi:hypothetical protein